ncbi:MAG: amidohydrolase [Acidobacteriota bacterium]
MPVEMMIRWRSAAIMAALMALNAPNISAQTLREAIAKDYTTHLDSLFKHFHANPELSMQETATSDRLVSEIEGAGFQVTRNIGKTGFVGIMKNGAGPTVMIRADMDGLPILEDSGLPYASRKRQVNLKGQEMPVMHACGHDMHMTTLVGVARRLAALRDQWRGTVMLLGQPAEESIGGAKAMVEDGLYERVGRPDYALALHVDALTPAGKIVMNDGLMYSSADTVRIVVHGVGAHGAAPHRGKDPIVLASQIVLALQTIVTREISPLQPGIVTVGAFHSGTAPNIISNQAVLDLTVRSNREETRRTILAAIERIARNAGRMAGLPEDKLPAVTVSDSGVPPTVNDKALTHRVRAAIQAAMGAEVFLPFEQTDMGAEDFPMLVNVDPPIASVYFAVGGTPLAALEAAATGGAPVADHHSPLFKISPEPSVRAGVEAMVVAALDLLAKP